MIRMLCYRVFYFAMFLLAMASCNNGYEIKGHTSISGLDGKMVYIKAIKNGEWAAVDSAEVLHGSFKMNGSVDSTVMVTLYMGNESIMPMVLEKGNIEVTIAPTKLQAKGTVLNDMLAGFIDKRNEQEARLAELERKEARLVLDGANVDDVQNELKAEEERLMKETREHILQFIKDNNSNVLGPAVFMMICSTLPYPVITPELEEIISTVPASFKADPAVSEFLEKAKENMKLIEDQQRMRESAALNANKK